MLQYTIELWILIYFLTSFMLLKFSHGIPNIYVVATRVNVGVSVVYPDERPVGSGAG